MPSLRVDKSGYIFCDEVTGPEIGFGIGSYLIASHGILKDPREDRDTTLASDIVKSNGWSAAGTYTIPDAGRFRRNLISEIDYQVRLSAAMRDFAVNSLRKAVV